MCVSMPKIVQFAFARAGLRAISDVHVYPSCLQWALLTVDETDVAVNCHVSIASDIVQ